MNSVGGMSVGRPFEVVRPRPALSSPRGFLGSSAVHIGCPPAHGITGHDILADSLDREMLGGDDADLAGFHIAFLDDSADAAEVIDVAVGVDDRNDGLPGRCR